MIKYPEQKLTEPEMLVLFELSVLVKHISEMGLNLVANHLRYPILEIFQEIITVKQWLSNTGEALLVFILLHLYSLILL